MKAHSITVTITSAIELTKSQLDSIKAAVSQKHKVDEVVLDTIIDPSCIGGVKLTINSVEHDATVRGKLEQVRSQLFGQM